MLVRQGFQAQGLRGWRSRRSRRPAPGAFDDHCTSPFFSRSTALGRPSVTFRMLRTLTPGGLQCFAVPSWRTDQSQGDQALRQFVRRDLSRGFTLRNTSPTVAVEYRPPAGPWRRPRRRTRRCHHLAGGLHLGTEHRVHAGELGEGEDHPFTATARAFRPPLPGP